MNERDNVIQIDLKACSITINNAQLNLPSQEYTIFTLLCRAKGDLVSKQEMASALWPEYNYAITRSKRIDIDLEDSIETTIWRLRRKIEPDPKRPCYIRTRRGLGYYLDISSQLPGEAVPEQSSSARLLRELWNLAHPTTRLWPEPAEAIRGLGMAPETIRYTYRLGTRLVLGLDWQRPGHLLLLDEGPEGTVYCLCPSEFAPQTRLEPGRSFLPQPEGRYRAFTVGGSPGREFLLAVITEAPLGLHWVTDNPTQPAYALNDTDVAHLLQVLDALGTDHWTALSTYFDIV